MPPIPLIEVHFNIIRSTPRSCEWSLSLRSPHQNPVCLCSVCWCYFVCCLLVVVFCMQYIVCWYYLVCSRLFFGTKTRYLCVIEPSFFWLNLTCHRNGYKDLCYSISS